jgi:hypothetical protein
LIIRSRIEGKRLYEKWRWASRPAVEGGILPPGENTPLAESFIFYQAFGHCDVLSAGLEARLYVSQDG